MLSTYPSPVTVPGAACSPVAVQASSDVQLRSLPRTRSATAMPSAFSDDKRRRHGGRCRGRGQPVRRRRRRRPVGQHDAEAAALLGGGGGGVERD
eukprot:3407689-Prymnesium_polylepis.1